MAFNLTKKPFDDVRVRKAIANVINFEELGEKKRRALIRDSQPRFLELAPYVLTYQSRSQNALQSWVRGLRLGAATLEKVWHDEIWFDGASKR